MDNTTIHLTKAANGFIVQLPFRVEYLPPVDYTDPKVIRKMASVMRDEMQGDPLLKKLQGDLKEENPIQDYQDQQKSNIYVFKTFDEIIVFLKEQFNEGPKYKSF